MKKTGFVLLSLLLLATVASAQIPSVNVFFGYSYYNTDLSSNVNRTSANGWEASVEGKVIPFLGIVADFDGHYGSQNFVSVCAFGGVCSVSGNFTENNYLFGPRVSMSVGKLRPFAEALVGAGHVSVNNGFGTDTSFAEAIGAGVDYKLFHLLAWRLQGDYVGTHLLGARQNNARVSTGIVVHF
jgi:Lipid A 3-O-deacylase (PagL)